MGGMGFVFKSNIPHTAKSAYGATVSGLIIATLINGVFHSEELSRSGFVITFVLVFLINKWLGGAEHEYV